MTTIDSARQTPGAPAEGPDMAAVMAFLMRAVDELGASLNTSLVVMGDKLGFYRSLADDGPATPAELAARTGTDARYVREWLNAQAAGDYLGYDATTGRFILSPEHALVLADPRSPAYLAGFFQIVEGTVRDAPAIREAAATGAGYGWDAHNSDVHVGCERFFRTSYATELVANWLPALDGVVEKLTAGARVADVGCGHGASTVLMAQAFPASTFVGSDYHLASVETARQRAEAAGVADRVTFERADARSFGGAGFDLVTMFDCLHDLGDPVGAARRVRSALAPDGTWMIVEPQAGDQLEDNLNPVGRAYYAFSTLLCTPNSLSQEVGLALGTQAGPARLRAVVTEAGFGSSKVVAGTPFNMVLEVRP
jgi:2-polyprenyl-3-methyl-5-hydroxy-6-metoxy-1,4-benzoquinol methylase